MTHVVYVRKVIPSQQNHVKLSIPIDGSSDLGWSRPICLECSKVAAIENNKNKSFDTSNLSGGDDYKNYSSKTLNLDYEETLAHGIMENEKASSPSSSSQLEPNNMQHDPISIEESPSTLHESNVKSQLTQDVTVGIDVSPATVTASTSSSQLTANLTRNGDPPCVNFHYVDKWYFIMRQVQNFLLCEIQNHRSIGYGRFNRSNLGIRCDRDNNNKLRFTFQKSIRPRDWDEYDRYKALKANCETAIANARSLCSRFTPQESEEIAQYNHDANIPL